MPFLTGYGKRKEIRYGTAFPGANLTDFPKLLVISGDSDIAAELAGGGGIAVTEDDGETEVPFGLYPSSDPSSGDLILRAKFPAILTAASTGDVLGYLYYDAGGTTTEDKAGVVDNGYVLFAPLGEDPSGSAPQTRNWATDTLTGTSSGTMTSGDLVAAQVGDGIDFDGSDDAISFDSSVTSLLGEATASILYNLTSGADRGPLVKQGVGGLTNISLQAFSFPDGIQFGWGSFSANDFDSAWVTAGWHRVDFVRTGSSGSWAYALYLDGVLKSSGSGITGNPWGSGTTGAGIGGNFNDGNLVGVLNEAQLSDVARSADWLEYAYEDDFNNADTFTLGAEEIDGGGPPPANFYGTVARFVNHGVIRSLTRASLVNHGA